jgi:hypothetical protein
MHFRNTLFLILYNREHVTEYAHKFVHKIQILKMYTFHRFYKTRKHVCTLFLILHTHESVTEYAHKVFLSYTILKNVHFS